MVLRVRAVQSASVSHKNIRRRAGLIKSYFLSLMHAAHTALYIILNPSYFSSVFSETGGICIAPRPSDPDAEIVPGMAMRPFFGIKPVLMDTEVWCSSLCVSVCVCMCVCVCVCVACYPANAGWLWPRGEGQIRIMKQSPAVSLLIPTRQSRSVRANPPPPIQNLSYYYVAAAVSPASVLNRLCRQLERWCLCADPSSSLSPHTHTFESTGFQQHWCTSNVLTRVPSCSNHISCLICLFLFCCSFIFWVSPGKGRDLQQRVRSSVYSSAVARYGPNNSQRPPEIHWDLLSALSWYSSRANKSLWHFSTFSAGLYISHCL